ncbi:MAG: MFS transporter [Proteobacteria bacterium]|nr:MFS transporter [Pseudomonadota bacterium]
MDQQSKIESRWPVLIATTLSSFLTPLALSTVNVALPSIGREFSINALTLSWIATAYILSAAIFLLPFGKLADMYGRKKIFIYGTCIFTLSSLLMGVSKTPEILIGCRVLQGIGGAMIFGTGIAILTSVFPAGERGKVLGINVAAVYLGLSFGPFLGGILTQHLGWRSIFFLNVPFGVIIMVFSIWKVKGEWAEARGETFDAVGSLIYSIMLLCIMYGFSRLPGRSGFTLICAGIVGIGIFVYWELRAKNPILNISLLRTNRAFTLSNMAALIHYGATFAVGFLLSFYLQHIKGLSPQGAGVILVSQPIVQALISPIAGRISDSIEPRIVASLGMGITATGLFLLVFLKTDTAISFIVSSLCILGFGFALFSSPNTNAIMSSVESRLYGVASSMLATMRLLGQMFSMGIAMLIFATYLGRVEIAPAFYPHLLKSIQVAFIIFGFLCIVGIFASLTRGNVRQ